MPASTTNLPFVFFDNTNNLGRLSISNNAGQAVLKWTPGARVRLQSSGDLTGSWLEVPNTQGSNSATVNISGQQSFRLIGP